MNVQIRITTKTKRLNRKRVVAWIVFEPPLCEPLENRPQNILEAVEVLSKIYHRREEIKSQNKLGSQTKPTGRSIRKTGFPLATSLPTTKTHGEGAAAKQRSN